MARKKPAKTKEEKDKRRMKRLVRRHAKILKKQGFWPKANIKNLVPTGL